MSDFDPIETLEESDCRNNRVNRSILRATHFSCKAVATPIVIVGSLALVTSEGVSSAREKIARRRTRRQSRRNVLEIVREIDKAQSQN